MKAGGLVSDDLILRLISNELNQRGWLQPNQGPPEVLTLSSSALSASGDTMADDASDAAFLSTPSPRRTASGTPSYAAPLHHGFPHQQPAAPAPAQPPPPQASDDPAASFLLDGFPRTAGQAGRLDAIVPINLAVSITTPFSILLDRVAGRWVHEPSGRIYNEAFNAPACPRSRRRHRRAPRPPPRRLRGRLPRPLPQVPRDQRAPARALRPQGRAVGGPGPEQRRDQPQGLPRV